MLISNIESCPNPDDGALNPRRNGSELAARIEQLTDRQRSYLRLVLQLKSSKDIAAATGDTSYRAVDKQLLKANAILGVGTRVEAAQMLATYDQGVEHLHPANALPSAPPDFRLSRPWPTVGAAANMLTLRHAASWTVIIAIVMPVGLTAAGMAYLTLLLLLRFQPF